MWVIYRGGVLVNSVIVTVVDFTWTSPEVVAAMAYQAANSAVVHGVGAYTKSVAFVELGGTSFAR